MYNITEQEVSNFFDTLLKRKVEVDFSIFREALCEVIQKAVFVGETVHPRYYDQRAVCIVFHSNEMWDSCDVMYELDRLTKICDFFADESIVLNEGKHGLDFLYVSMDCIRDAVLDTKIGEFKTPFVRWCQCNLDPTK